MNAEYFKKPFGEFFFIFLVGVCLVDCGNPGNVNIKVSKDENGKIKSEIPYINDTLKHGTAKYYYSSGVLEDQIEFRYGLQDGWNEHYRENGTIESKSYWRNDMPEGESYYYYENGKLKSESFMANGKQFGPAKIYFVNGQMKNFYMTDFSGETFYVIVWDSLGNKVKEEGLVFSRNFDLNPPGDSMRKNMEIMIKMAVAQLPDMKTSIRITGLDKENTIELPIENYTATFKRTFAETGIHSFKVMGEIRGIQHNNLYKRDSIQVEVKIRE